MYAVCDGNAAVVGVAKDIQKAVAILWAIPSHAILKGTVNPGEPCAALQCLAHRHDLQVVSRLLSDYGDRSQEHIDGKCRRRRKHTRLPMEIEEEPTSPVGRDGVVSVEDKVAVDICHEFRSYVHYAVRVRAAITQNPVSGKVAQRHD